jgi:hypothetical protein
VDRRRGEVLTPEQIDRLQRRLDEHEAGGRVVAS